MPVSQIDIPTCYDLVSGAAKQPSSSTQKPHVFSANQELFQYLEDYAIADKECPEFAVGIYGDWGIGKTFFIQEWLKYRHLSHCYLSLFGISSIDSIEEAIFKTEHPVLSSPAMKASLEVASVFSKNQIAQKFPKLLATLTGEVKKLTNNLQQPSEGVPSSSCARPLLVFDDIERTSLPYPILFGYLSTLLQCRGYKIVLLYNRGKLANICDKQLKALNKDNTFFHSFNSLLQKAVGIEFAFQGDFEDALQAIFAHHPELLPKNLAFYRSIVEKTGNNLRQVKQALWRFKYRWPSEIQLTQEQQQTVFTLYLAASCEFPLLLFKDISPFVQRIAVDQKCNFYNKYVAVIPADFDCPLSPDLMTSLINPDTPRDKLARQIDAFLSAAKKGIPSWRTLMNYHFISENQFKQALADIRSRLTSPQSFLEAGELLHIIELAERLQTDLYLSEDQSSELIKLASDKLQCLFEENPGNLAVLDEPDFRQCTWGGYGFSTASQVETLYRHYRHLFQEKQEIYLTATLSSVPPDLNLARDLILKKKPLLSPDLCEANKTNFIKMLATPDTCTEGTMFAEFFMKEMQLQHLDAKAFFSNILNEIRPPAEHRFAQARFKLMQDHLNRQLSLLSLIGRHPAI